MISPFLFYVSDCFWVVGEAQELSQARSQVSFNASWSILIPAQVSVYQQFLYLLKEFPLKAGNQILEVLKNYCVQSIECYT